MINEELVEKSVEVGFRISNLTLDLILKGLDAVTKGLEKKPNEKPLDAQTPKEPELKQGKQTLKQLHKHNEGLAVIELKDPNLRELHKSMKKSDIDFSCVKDGKGCYTLFFKGKNADEMTSAFKRYTEKVTGIADKKAVRADRKTEKAAAREEKQSIRAELRAAKKEAKALEAGRDKVKNRGKGARGL